MGLRHWLFFSLVFTCCLSEEMLNVTYMSHGYPDFYLGDQIAFRCIAHGYHALAALSYVFKDSVYGRTGCSKIGWNGWYRWASTYRDHKNLSSNAEIESLPLSDEYCSSVGNIKGFTMDLNVTFTSTQTEGYLYCLAVINLEFSNTAAQSGIWIHDIKVAPKNLAMALTPSQVIEGQQFTVSCNSTGGKPTSSFAYEMRIGNATTLISHNTTYIPTKEDRDGITVQCRDTSHPNWKGGSAFKSVVILPLYLDINHSMPASEWFDGSMDHRLNCTEYIVGHPQPVNYTWIRQGQIEAETSNVLPLFDTGGVDSVEQLICIAENEIGHSVNVTWNIVWNKIPETPDGPTKVYHIVFSLLGAAVFAIIGICIVVVVVRRKRNREARNLAKKAEDLTLGEAEYAQIDEPQNVKYPDYSDSTSVLRQPEPTYDTADNFCPTPASGYVHNAFLAEPPQLPSRPPSNT